MGALCPWNSCPCRKDKRDLLLLAPCDDMVKRHCKPESEPSSDAKSILRNIFLLSMSYLVYGIWL